MRRSAAWACLYWPSHTFWMPSALVTASRWVLSEKHECSSSWSWLFSATSSRSPASSPRDSEPRPTCILRTGLHQRGEVVNEQLRHHVQVLAAAVGIGGFAIHKVFKAAVARAAV